MDDIGLRDFRDKILLQRRMAREFSVGLPDHSHTDARRFQFFRRAERFALLPGGDHADLQPGASLRRREAQKRVGRPAVTRVDAGDGVEDAHHSG